MSDKLAWNLSHSSGNGLVQQGHLLLENDRKGLDRNDPMREGPQLNEVDSFVSRKVFPNGRAKEVRIKLTDDERSNLRVAVFETYRDVRR